MLISATGSLSVSPSNSLRVTATLLQVPELDLYNPVDDAVEAAGLIPNATLLRLAGQSGHAVAADASPQLADMRRSIGEFLIRFAA